MIRRLRVKFICINMAIVTVMMLAILGMLLHFTRDDLEQQSIRVMQSVMEDRAYPSRPGEFPRQAKLPYFYVSVNTMGELSASFGGYYDLTNTEAIQEIITLALNSDDQTGILKDYSLRFQKRTTPFGQTIVFVDMSSELATMRSLTDTCILIGVLGFAVFLGLSFLLARWAVKPVETAWNQQRQFVADASHELKTPLTVILTNAELLQEPEYDEQARSRFVDSIMTMSRQMRGLVESLLELARVDNGGQNMVFSRLNFSELVSDALLPFEPVYFEKGLTLESNVEENLFVKGSPAAPETGGGHSAGQRIQVRFRRFHGAGYPAAAGEPLPALRGKRRGRHIQGGFEEHFQAVLPHGQGQKHEPQLRSGAVHCGQHRFQTRRQNLGGKRGRGQYLLCPAAHGINIRDGTAVPASFIHRYVTIF